MAKTEDCHPGSFFISRLPNVKNNMKSDFVWLKVAESFHIFEFSIGG